MGRLPQGDETLGFEEIPNQVALLDFVFHTGALCLLCVPGAK